MCEHASDGVTVDVDNKQGTFTDWRFVQVKLDTISGYLSTINERARARGSQITLWTRVQLVGFLANAGSRGQVPDDVK
jgi:hypothetical protein